MKTISSKLKKTETGIALFFLIFQMAAPAAFATDFMMDANTGAMIAEKKYDPSAASGQVTPAVQSLPALMEVSALSPVIQPDNPKVPQGWSRTGGNGSFAFRLVDNAQVATSKDLQILDLRNSAVKTVATLSKDQILINLKDKFFGKPSVSEDGKVVIYENTSQNIPHGTFEIRYARQVNTVLLSDPSKKDRVSGHSGSQPLPLDQTTVRSITQPEPNILRVDIFDGAPLLVDTRTMQRQLIWTVTISPNRDSIYIFGPNRLGGGSIHYASSVYGPSAIESVRVIESGGVGFVAVDLKSPNPSGFTMQLFRVSLSSPLLTNIKIPNGIEIRRFEKTAQADILELEILTKVNEITILTINAKIIPAGNASPVIKTEIWSITPGNREFAYRIVPYSGNGGYKSLELRNLKTGQITQNFISTPVQNNFKDVTVSADGKSATFKIVDGSGQLIASHYYDIAERKLWTVAKSNPNFLFGGSNNPNLRSLVLRNLKTGQRQTLATFPVGLYGDNVFRVKDVSPDGQNVAFDNGNGVQVRKINNPSSQLKIALVYGLASITWRDDNTVIFKNVGGSKTVRVHLRRMTIV